MASNLSRQYLKAMGIDSWQHRDAQLAGELPCNEPASSSPRAAANPSAQSDITNRPEPQLQQFSRVADWAMSSFGQSLAESTVVVSNLSEQGQMLLVLERDLTSAAEDLLAAMLKAIKIDRLSQSAVTLSHSAAGESLEQICVRVQPSIVVVMAMLTDVGVITELDDHRQTLHRFNWLNVPVAITLHPQVLLENPQGKRPAWEDLKRVKAFLDG